MINVKYYMQKPNKRSSISKQDRTKLSKIDTAVFAEVIKFQLRKYEVPLFEMQTSFVNVIKLLILSNKFELIML